MISMYKSYVGTIYVSSHYHASTLGLGRRFTCLLRLCKYKCLLRQDTRSVIGLDPRQIMPQNLCSRRENPNPWMVTYGTTLLWNYPREIPIPHGRYGPWIRAVTLASPHLAACACLGHSSNPRTIFSPSGLEFPWCQFQQGSSL